MSAPEVITREIDLSTRVPGFNGVYAGLVLPTNRGPVDKPTLVTSDTDLLRRYTINETVPIDGNDAFFSALAFLEKGDKLWVIRCAGEGALYGGAEFNANGSDATQADNVSFTNGTMTPAYYPVADKKFVLYAADPGAWNNDIKIKVFRNRAFDSIQPTAYDDQTTVGSDVLFYIDYENSKVATNQDWQTGEPVRVAIPDNVTIEDTGEEINYKLPNGLNTTSVFYVVKAADTYLGGEKWVSTVMFATSYNKAKQAAAQLAIIADAEASTAEKTAAQEALNGLIVKFTRNARLLDAKNGLASWNANTLFEVNDTDAVVRSGGNFKTGDAVYVVGEGLPTDTPKVMYIIRLGSNKFKLAATLADSYAGRAFVGNNAGGSASQIKVYGCNGIKMLPVKSTKTPNTGLIEVFVGADEENPVESFVFSRVEGTRNADGVNIYLNTLLEASNYVRGLVNNADTNPDDTYDAETGTWSDVCTATVLKVQAIALPLAGGDDGDQVTDADMIKASDVFKNKESYPMTILMDGGYPSIDFQKALISLAEGRKFCMALLSTPVQKEDASDYLNSIVSFKMNELNPNTSYAALYTPHVELLDRYNNVYRMVAPDGYAAAAISYTAYNYEMWYPVGGFRRGVINVRDVNRRFTKGEMDYLYDNGINPIRFYPGKGIVIWGQKTLSSRPSALDRMNVRLMLIVIEPAIEAALEDFLFELNDEATRGLVKTMIDNYMEGIKGRRGVYDYYTVCDDSNNSADDIDNYRMNVWLFVKPTKAVEYIPFSVVITSTGMDFSLAQQSL